MKKNFKFYAVSWAILLVLFNVICFATPNEAAGMDKFGGAFWAGYAFITAAFIGQLICAYIAFKAENNEKFFYNVPLIALSYSGAVLTAVFGAAAMAVPNVPNWVGIIGAAVILAFTAIRIVSAKAAGEEALKTGEKLESKTEFIKKLRAEVEGLMPKAKTEEEKTSVRRVLDALKYSDPVSGDTLFEIEGKINDMFSAFSVSLDEAAEKELLALIKEREIKCRAMK